MDPATASLLMEGAKFSLQAYFNYMKLAGKTEEEAEALFQSEKTQLAKNNPADLEDA